MFGKYKVYVDDNYHHMDKSERYTAGSYFSLEKAIKKCKEITIQSLEEFYEEGITQEQLDAEIAYTQQMYESGAGLSEFEPYADELASLSKDLDARLASEPSAIKAMDDDLELLQRKANALRDNNIISQEELAELAEYDALIARVDELQPVIESGAACVIKRR